MRKLAKIVSIDSIHPIENADAIEVAIVGGWKVVTKKGEYSVGDLAVYLEIDSWVPTELAPFLSKGKEPKEFNGVKGERLRTMRLRGQISQGLLLSRLVALDKVGEIHEDMDVTELLNIQKWERAPDTRSSEGFKANGKPKGSFPERIHKTDQERVQNIKRELREAIESGERFEVTEKMEGSSMTVYKIDGVFGVCSRNIDLTRQSGNSFWDLAIRLNLEEKMTNYDNIALQGELVGPGVQGNIYGLTQHEFLMFDVFDVEEGKYVLPPLRYTIGDELDLYHAPILHFSPTLKELGLETMDNVIDFADGDSDFPHGTTGLPVKREGLVFKSTTRDFSFKAISNAYLLSEK